MADRAKLELLRRLDSPDISDREKLSILRQLETTEAPKGATGDFKSIEDQLKEKLASAPMSQVLSGGGFLGVPAAGGIARSNVAQAVAAGVEAPFSDRSFQDILQENVAKVKEFEQQRPAASKIQDVLALATVLPIAGSSRFIAPLADTAARSTARSIVEQSGTGETGKELGFDLAVTALLGAVPAGIGKLVQTKTGQALLGKSKRLTTRLFAEVEKLVEKGKIKPAQAEAIRERIVNKIPLLRPTAKGTKKAIEKSNRQINKEGQKLYDQLDDAAGGKAITNKGVVEDLAKVRDEVATVKPELAAKIESKIKLLQKKFKDPVTGKSVTGAKAKTIRESKARKEFLNKQSGDKNIDNLQKKADTIEKQIIDEHAKNVAVGVGKPELGAAIENNNLSLFQGISAVNSLKKAKGALPTPAEFAGSFSSSFGTILKTLIGVRALKNIGAPIAAKGLDVIQRSGPTLERAARLGTTVGRITAGDKKRR